jgi:hypothetical protein
MSQTKAQLIEGSAASELTAAKTLLGAGSAGAPSLTATGDTNTGIFFPTADTIAFAEGGVETVRIDSSGRVGIGTASLRRSCRDWHYEPWRILRGCWPNWRQPYCYVSLW